MPFVQDCFRKKKKKKLKKDNIPVVIKMLMTLVAKVAKVQKKYVSPASFWLPARWRCKSNEEEDAHEPSPNIPNNWIIRSVKTKEERVLGWVKIIKRVSAVNRVDCVDQNWREDQRVDGVWRWWRESSRSICAGQSESWMPILRKCKIICCFISNHTPA